MSAAAGRSAAGASSQTSSSSSAVERRPRSSAATQPPLAVEPVLQVLAQLRLRIPHDRAVPRAQSVELQLLQASQRLEVSGQRAAAGRDEDAALAEHGVAAEQRPRPPAARRGRRSGPASRSPGTGPARHRPRSTTSGSRPAQRRLLEPASRGRGACGHRRPRALAQLRHGLRVVEVVVGQDDARDPAPLLRRLPHALDVRRRPPGRDRSPMPARRSATCSCPRASSVRRSTRAPA